MTSTVLATHPDRRFEIVDVDEARQYVATVYGDVTLEPTERRARFHWDVKRASVGPIHVACSWFRGGARFLTQEANDRYFMFFSRKRQGELRVGVDVPIIPGRAAAIRSPSTPGDLRVESDYQPLTLAFERATLEAAFRALAGSSKRFDLRFEPGLSTTSGIGARIQRLVGFIFNELDQDDNSLDSPLIAAHYADALIFSLLESVSHSCTALLPSRIRAAAPRHVRMAAEYLDGNAAEPVRLAELSKLTGMSVRSIQAGFKAAYGCSPMAFLKQRRLELARNRLLSAPPGTTTVAEVALDCGFAHLGRFSALYRARFGESPSATVRRDPRTARSG
jgi:AraC-like DNA-binding protein